MGMQTKNIVIGSIFFLYLVNLGFTQESNHINIFGNMPFPGSTAVGNYNNSQASIIASEGGYLLDSSMANINNQQAYSMSLDNQIKKASTYFEKRQINMFYRDLEYWQHKERSKLKRSGSLDRDAIYRLYGR
jgi:hypothetical protein